jgi:predicted DNA binding CopG/RHH family protein
MALGMIVFYILGIFIKNTILNIGSDIEEKKRKLEQERLEKERQEEETREEQARQEAAGKQGNKSSRIDIRVEDDDEFIPLDIEKISDKLKEGNGK